MIVIRSNLLSWIPFSKESLHQSWSLFKTLCISTTHNLKTTFQLSSNYRFGLTSFSKYYILSLKFEATRRLSVYFLMKHLIWSLVSHCSMHLNLKVMSLNGIAPIYCCCGCRLLCWHPSTYRQLTPQRMNQLSRQYLALVISAWSKWEKISKLQLC